MSETNLILEYKNSLQNIIANYLTISHEIKAQFQKSLASHFASDEGEESLLRWLWTDELSFEQSFLKFKNLMKIRYEKYALEYDYVFLELDQFSEILDSFLHKISNSKHDKLECAKDSKVYFTNDSDVEIEYSLSELLYKIVVLKKTIIPAVNQICSDIESGAAKEIELS